MVCVLDLHTFPNSDMIQTNCLLLNCVVFNQEIFPVITYVISSVAVKLYNFNQIHLQGST